MIEEWATPNYKKFQDHKYFTVSVWYDIQGIILGINWWLQASLNWTAVTEKFPQTLSIDYNTTKQSWITILGPRIAVWSPKTKNTNLLVQSS